MKLEQVQFCLFMLPFMLYKGSYAVIHTVFGSQSYVTSGKKICCHAIRIFEQQLNYL